MSNDFPLDLTIVIVFDAPSQKFHATVFIDDRGKEIERKTFVTKSPDDAFQMARVLWLRLCRQMEGYETEPIKAYKIGELDQLPLPFGD